MSENEKLFREVCVAFASWYQMGNDTPEQTLNRLFQKKDTTKNDQGETEVLPGLPTLTSDNTRASVL
jgi:hypothetical protein